MLTWLLLNHALNKVTEKNEGSSAICEVYRSIGDLIYLVRQILFIFSASFLLAKGSERFIFLGIFCNHLVKSFLNFQSRVGGLFCENNQKWPKTTHCFDTFDSSDAFDSSDSNERFWQIFTNVEDRGQYTGESSGCTKHHIPHEKFQR